MSAVTDYVYMDDAHSIRLQVSQLSGRYELGAQQASMSAIAADQVDTKYW
jgi:hypothetical protein